MNDKEVFSLSDVRKKVICNDISCDLFEEDMCRRAAYLLNHKYEQCMKRLREEWMPKLKGKVDSVPLDDDKFAELVFSQPDYMDRKARDEAAAKVG